ncbi:ribonuclease P protein component [Roseofilum casamattae]|uniref:Ribonuclease P protein component n=1 Tax=Roseofilum casamattae BLCC-M143 TaxID=3022442 RepID=A0ABT7BXJ2_9CYAN|nr:ribonuclease P protein component [Roseofilum casamattae]MDJ1183886.1 ribonuclease P protein component [Roseofilum casamattae BLCC-M143]
MLPKANRLKNRRHFAGVYRQGIRHQTPHLTLRALGPAKLGIDPLSANAPPTKIGIVVSKKVDKRAVYRNRIQRQLRAKLREYLPRIPNGWRLAIVVRPGTKPCQSNEFIPELERLLSKIADKH